MIVGSNPRLEAPVLNARIRKRWLKGELPDRRDRASGPTSPTPTTISAPGRSRSAAFAEQPAGRQSEADVHRRRGGLRAAGRRGGAGAAGQGGRGRLGVVKDGWNGFNVLHTAASRVGGLDLGLVPGEGGLDAPAMAKAGALDVLFNLGADEIDVEPGAFVVYIGTHGDRGAHRADVILPGAAYTEKTGIYVNTEGRPQFAERAVFPPGDAREDWSILRALSERARREAAVTIR